MATMLLIGCVWGFLEAVLGGALHFVQFPLAGQVMAPIGFGLMYLGMKSGLKPYHLPVVSLIAASFKFFDVALFSLPFADIHILNPAQAILMQGVAFAALAALTKRLSLMSLLANPLSIGLFNAASLVIFGTVSAASFYYMPLGILLTFAILYTLRGRTWQIGSISYAWKMSSSAALVVVSILVRGLIA